MRVVIPVMGLDFGGGERIIAEIANGLTARGHEVILVLPYGGRIVWPIRAAVAWVPNLTPASIPPGDIILPNFYPTVFPAVKSRKGRCVRLSLAYEPLWIPQARATYDLPIPVIVISQWQRSLVSRHGARTFLLHPGVDAAVFHPCPKPRDRVKRVLYLKRGRGYSWKGEDDFVAAHGMLAPAFPDLQVIVVTGGGHEPNSPPYPRPCVQKTAGSDGEMGRIYAEADLFVFPSHFESFGLPVLEAMACGTAVVVTECGGVAEFARHLENCLVAAPGNPSALASTIIALLRDPVTRARLAEGGLNTAAQWSWQRTYQEIEDILCQVLCS